MMMMSGSSGGGGDGSGGAVLWVQYQTATVAHWQIQHYVNFSLGCSDNVQNCVSVLLAPWSSYEEDMMAGFRYGLLPWKECTDAKLRLS